MGFNSRTFKKGIYSIDKDFRFLFGRAFEIKRVPWSEVGLRLETGWESGRGRRLAQTFVDFVQGLHNYN